MEKTKKYPAFIMFYVVAFLALQILVLAFVKLENPFSNNYFWFTTEVLLLLVLFASSKMRKRKITEQIGLKKITPRSGLVALFVGLSMGVMTASVLSIISPTDIRFTYGYPLWFFILFTIENSIFKEVYYRGYILNELRKELPMGQAVLIQGVIYSILFMGLSLWGLILSFIGTILFILVYRWTGSIVGSMITQAANTTVIALLQNGIVDILNKKTDVALFIAGIALSLASILLLRHFRPDKPDAYAGEKKKWAASPFGILCGFIMVVAYMILYIGGGDIPALLQTLQLPLICAFLWLIVVFLQKSRLRDRFERALPTAGFMLMCATVLTAVMSALGMLNGFLGETIDGYWDFITGNQALFTLAYCLIVSGFFALIYKSQRGSVLKEWNFRPMTGKPILFAAAIGVLITVFNTALTSIPYIREAYPVFDIYMDAFTCDMESLTLQIICVLAIPFLEEIIFRGILHREIRSKYNLIAGLAVSALLYAYFQGDTIIAVYSVLASIVYVLCYEFGASIWSSIIVQEVNMVIMLIVRRTGLHMEISKVPVPALIAITALSVTVLVAMLIKPLKAGLKEGGKRNINVKH